MLAKKSVLPFWIIFGHHFLYDVWSGESWLDDLTLCNERNISIFLSKYVSMTIYQVACSSAIDWLIYIFIKKKYSLIIHVELLYVCKYLFFFWFVEFHLYENDSPCCYMFLLVY